MRRRPLVRIRNIHERIIDADPADIAPLLATLGQPDDALYPPLWEPMRFDKPVGVGASGTHGTISAYEPGSLIEITFPSGTGITGTHTFTVTSLGPGRSLARHDVDARATPIAWLAWISIIAPAHNPIIEELLDRLQSAVGAPPTTPAKLSAYARLLRWFDRARIRPAETDSRSGN